MALLSSCGSPALVRTTHEYSCCSTRELVVPAVVTLSSFPSKPSSTNFGLPPCCHKWRARISFFPAFLQSKRKKDPETLKQELLDAIASLDRGADASPEDQEAVDQIACQLEAVSPVKEPLKSDLLDGKWELLYTTSKSILQTGRPKFLRSRVTADLTPLNARKVAVKFDYFKIAGLVPVKAPDRARGELEITYLDEELRISRGDKGNLFILKMVDRSYKIPV